MVIDLDKIIDYKGVSCVYKITSPSNRVYVGSTSNLYTRFKSYRTSNCKRQRKLYHSFNKYGVSRHRFEIIEFVELEEDLYTREIYWGEVLNTLDKEVGLNLSLPKVGDAKQPLSEETLLKMSKSGKKREFTEEHKNRLSTYWIGKKFSDSHKEKLSKNNNKSKKVVDLATGIEYASLTEATRSLGLSYSTMKKQLNPNSGRTNRSTLIYKQNINN